MKPKFLLFFFVIFISLRVFCQNNQPAYQSNPNINFTDFINGVKHAYLLINDAAEKDISENHNIPESLILVGLIEYLKDIGFEDATWGSAKNIVQNYPSRCDLVLVSPSWNASNNGIFDIKLTFISCNNDVFRFDAKNTIWIKDNFRIAFHRRCLEMYNLKTKYDNYQRLNLPSEMTEWDEEKLKKQYHENGADLFEGIYEAASSTNQSTKYKLGVIKVGTNYNLIYLSGAINSFDWHVGEIKSILSPTATTNLFKAEWKMGDKSKNDNALVSFEPGLMNLAIQGRDKSVYIKLYPTADDVVKSSKNIQSAGTGFGISSNGLIVTNSHVASDANKIKVRGINGDFSNSLQAKLIVEDKKNDLAIIQIVDSSFKTLGTIPYTIDNKSSDVGTSVFVLGYPLKALMGDEIKLTNGIISSKTGFQGDITSYQISVPIQPGNSGGPLFDVNGNLIGIVNAKLTVGENVSYAIKSPYLINLIDLLPNLPKLTNVNLLVGKPLTEQVKMVNKFIYIIEVNGN
jgi:S1-C subfamily serine protease